MKQSDTETFRYEERNEIENIIKENNIDRDIFHEVGKSDYEKVIKRLYYSFCNYQKYPEIQLPYMWTRFRKGLKQTELIRTDWNNWDTYVDNIRYLIPEDKNMAVKYYLVVDGGWVYEGSLNGIIKVLYDYPVIMDDFYIFPKDYSWSLVHCDDGECMFKVWN